MRALSALRVLARGVVVAVVLALVVAGCDPSCGGVTCGPCQQAVELTVHLNGAALGPVTASGVDAVRCSATGDGSFYCGAGALPAGSYSLTLSAPGHLPETLTFALTPPGDGCCACGGSFSREVTLTPSGDADAGTRDASVGDAGTDDAGLHDAGTDDAGLHDAGTDDAGACDPSAIRFPSGSSLTVGQLCDDVFACVADESAAMALMAASARFTCSATPEAGCPGWTCAYRAPSGPSVLDAAEIAELCKVSVLVPQPTMTCMIYL